MSKDKYVAYVGTYTHGSSIGIHVYDLDVENGYMTEREVVPVNNASHVAKSNNGKYLYSIADEGVEVLLSGHHANIEKWRREQSVIRTAERRPDLLEKADLSAKEKALADRFLVEKKLAFTQEV